MKQNELQKCALCQKGVMAAGDIAFFTLDIQHMVIDANAMRRAAGLEMQIGPLQRVMGPDEDLAHEMTRRKIFICQPCALDPGQYLAPVLFHEV